MTEYKDQEMPTNLIDLVESRWNGLYENIVATHKHLKETAVEIKVEGEPHWKVDATEHDKFLKTLIEFITMSNILMEWGESLKKAEQVTWTKQVFANMIGLEDHQELDKLIKDSVQKFAKA